MPVLTERVLLGLPPRWDTATFTASDEETGGEASNLAIPMHDKGWIVGLVWRPVDGQDETYYDNAPTTEGTVTGGSGYSAADVITLSDASTVTVDVEAAGVVTGFTVDSTTSTGAASGATLTQSSVAPPGGTGFTLTLDVDNVTGGSQSVVIDAGAAVDLNAIRMEGARCTGFAPEDLEVQVETASTAAIDADVTDWTGGSVAFRMQAAGGSGKRLDMVQADVGPTDAELLKIQAACRLSYLAQRDVGSELNRRYARLTFQHTGTPTAGQQLFLAHVWGGWAFTPDIGIELGQIKLSLVARPNGSFLSKIAMTLQVLQEDELWYRTWQEFLLTSGENNRCWVWWDPGSQQSYYQKSLTGQAFFEGVDLPTDYSDAAFRSLWPVEIVERFGVETER